MEKHILKCTHHESENHINTEMERIEQGMKCALKRPSLRFKECLWTKVLVELNAAQLARTSVNIVQNVSSTINLQLSTTATK